VGVDRVSWEVVDQIGFEYHRFVTDVEREKPQPRSENLIKFLRVLLRGQNRDSRSLTTPIEMVSGQEKGSRNKCPSA
jgi:hypothetical protein